MKCERVYKAEELITITNFKGIPDVRMLHTEQVIRPQEIIAQWRMVVRNGTWQLERICLIGPLVLNDSKLGVESESVDFYAETNRNLPPLSLLNLVQECRPPRSWSKRGWTGSPA